MINKFYSDLSSIGFHEVAIENRFFVALFILFTFSYYFKIKYGSYFGIRLFGYVFIMLIILEFLFNIDWVS